jgi:hypothetical protein
VSDFPVGYPGLDLDSNIICPIIPPNAERIYKYGREAGIITSICNIPYEVWSVCADKSNGKIYFGGYPQYCFSIFDPALPLSATNPLARPFTSEHYVYAKYIHNLHRMADNSIWATTQYIRQDTYGEIIRYDPDTDVDTNLGVGKFENYYLQNATSNLAKNTLVVSGWDSTDVTEATSVLFVLQIMREKATTPQEALTKIIPLPSSPGKPWRVVCVETGLAADANRFVCLKISSSPHQAICIDVVTGQIVWDSGSISGASFLLEYTEPQFAYGHVWYFNSLEVWKLNTTTGVTTPAQIGGVTITVPGTNYSDKRGLLWDTENKVLYMWSEENLQLYRIEGIDGI